MGRPYSIMDDNNSMCMVRHHLMHIDINIRKMFRDGAKEFVRDFSQRAENHFFSHYFPKQALAIFRHDSDKIRASRGIIMALQPIGTTMMFLWVEIQFSPLVINHTRKYWHTQAQE